MTIPLNDTTIPLNDTTISALREGADVLNNLLHLARPHVEAIITRYADAKLPECQSQSLRAKYFVDTYFQAEWLRLSALAMTDARQARQIALIKDFASLSRFLALHQAVRTVEQAVVKGSFEL